MTGHLYFEGDQYTDCTQAWLDAAPDTVEVDSAARALGLGMTGRAAARLLADTVRDRGPERGRHLVRYLFPDSADQGPADQNFTTIFKYACRRHGMLRFKLDPANPSSWIVAAFPEHAGDSHLGWFGELTGS